MKITPTALPEVLLITLQIYQDARGHFFESFHTQRYQENGLTNNFVQDNFSVSKKNVLRGLHYQLEHPQGKLVWVSSGKILDIAVDIRMGSPYFGQAIGVELDAQIPQQLYIPPGFAHGFCVLSDEAHFHYKCTDYYYPQAERGIAWNDPSLNIRWPIEQPILSSKDQHYPYLSDVPAEFLPQY